MRSDGHHLRGMRTVSGTRKLMDHARDGSDEAFGELVQLYQPRIRSYLGRFIRDSNVVDDLTQNTFLSSYRKLGSWRGDASLGTWLLAIARNEALLYLRDEKVRREREASALDAALSRLDHDRGDDAADSHETELAALETCLAGLPDRSARLIREFYFEGRTAREISEESGRKEVSVWVTIMRIRRALRDCIQARLAAPPNPPERSI
jgi:RNA polymerase sigma-70 factor, ECF subfamily